MGFEEPPPPATAPTATVAEAPPPPPPAYDDAIRLGAYPAQPTVVIQQQTQPTVLVQQPGVAYVTQPGVVIVHQIKVAPSFDPYHETCPYCNATVVTQRRFRQGSMFWLFFILGFFFIPFWYFLCCASFQDAYHYCPNCLRLISVRRR